MVSAFALPTCAEDPEKCVLFRCGDDTSGGGAYGGEGLSGDGKFKAARVEFDVNGTVKEN
jgi:hypothetical protein